MLIARISLHFKSWRVYIDGLCLVLESVLLALVQDNWNIVLDRYDDKS